MERAAEPRGMRPTPERRQVSFLPPEIAAILELVRENLRLLKELARRYEVGWLDPVVGARTVTGPADVAAYLGPEMAELAQEQLRVVLLDTKNRVLATELVCQGGLNAAVVRPADCFREAVRVGAASIILLHNHPSTDPTPSPEDVQLTADIARAGLLLGIELLDHIVLGGDAFVSLRERGLYTPPTVRSTLTPE
jgi:DNA repair protein RadC